MPWDRSGRERASAALPGRSRLLARRPPRRALGGGFEGESRLSRFTPGNPFDNDIKITFPLPPSSARSRVVFESRRLTAGVIAALPRGWKATAEASFAWLRLNTRIEATDYLVQQEVGEGINPFGDWALFQQAIIAAYRRQYSDSSQARNRLDEQTLRLAGPVFATLEQAFLRFGAPPEGHVTLDVTVSANSPSRR